MTAHKTVLLREAVEELKLDNGSVVVDATLGGGGHSMEILKKILPNGKLIAFDRDDDAIKRFRKRIEKLKEIKEGTNLFLVNSNFSNIKSVLSDLQIEKADAILADFGLSSDQLDDKERGFSFLSKDRLDMRMDRNQELSAFDVVNKYPEKELTELLTVLGDEKYARKIALEIVRQRSIKEISSTDELVEVIRKAVPASYTRMKVHFATRTFQAIRMEVNSELSSINKFLEDSVELLKSGGRLAVISFHSGEDRLVKRFFLKKMNKCSCPSHFPVCVCNSKPEITIITKKPIIPTNEEISDNPRSRSAKLRVLEKI